MPLRSARAWDNIGLSSPPQRPGTNIFRSTVFQLWWRDPTVVAVSNTEGKLQPPAASQGAGSIGKRNSRLSERIVYHWHITGTSQHITTSQHPRLISHIVELAKGGLGFESPVRGSNVPIGCEFWSLEVEGGLTKHGGARSLPYLNKACHSIGRLYGSVLGCQCLPPAMCCTYFVKRNVATRPPR